LDTQDLYWFRTEQARYLTQCGSADEAINRAQDALELIGDSDTAERGAAYWALGRSGAQRRHGARSAQGEGDTGFLGPGAAELNRGSRSSTVAAAPSTGCK